MISHDLDIHIEWDGPFTLKEVRESKTPIDYGLYQVYGHHPIYGSDVLLYIGQAAKQTIQLCSILVDTPREVIPELDQLDELINSPSIDPSQWEDIPALILRRLFIVIPEIPKLMLALESQTNDYPQSGRAALFIAESTHDIVEQFERLNSIADTF